MPDELFYKYCNTLWLTWLKLELSTLISKAKSYRIFIYYFKRQPHKMVIHLRVYLNIMWGWHLKG